MQMRNRRTFNEKRTPWTSKHLGIKGTSKHLGIKRTSKHLGIKGTSNNIGIKMKIFRSILRGRKGLQTTTHNPNPCRYLHQTGPGETDMSPTVMVTQ